MVALTFNKQEKLKKESQIEAVFTGGKALFVFPIKCMFRLIPIENNETTPKILVGVSVSKKKFKNATDRNSIKRKIKEIYRLHKPQLYTYVPNGFQVHLFFVYVNHQKMQYQKLNSKMEQLFVNCEQAWQSN